MKVKVPKELKIGVFSVKVGMKDYIRCDDGFKGTYNQRTGELYIDTQLRGEIRDSTFMHEVVHIIDHNYECGLSEENTSRIANGFVELLRNLKMELDWSEIDEALEQL